VKWDLPQDEIQVKAAVPTSLLPRGGQQPRRTNAPVEIHYVPVPKAKGAFVRKQETQDASYHAMAQSCIRIKNFGSAVRACPDGPIEYSWLYQMTPVTRQSATGGPSHRSVMNT
jgi:hypothetical protein